MKCRVVCLFLFLLLLCGGGGTYSCQTAKHAQTDKLRQERERIDRQAYKKAYKRHLKMQDNATKKRIRDHGNAQKKQFKQARRKR
jgi:hypothetical protein